ncbi:hypothetical protein NPIL_698321 [Nephila pilipes]|uniref:C2H2-type domain-containing protein n=1 Tax=Nephila pilipes TaxID=299642 RepID=A0A8X6K515_NEPPI|nr:hypothetical protein NPIL_698321 [Nephila pilipes]
MITKALLVLAIVEIVLSRDASLYTKVKILLSDVYSFERTPQQYPEYELLARTCLVYSEEMENTKHTASTLNISNKYCCKFCLKCFTRKRSLIDHINIHTGKRPYVCQFCSKNFTQRASCNRHVKLCHSDLSNKLN